MKSRIIWIDAVKFVAILMVLLAHMIWLFEQGMEKQADFSVAFLTINRIIASLGVPLFMMVSGTLLLGKKFETKNDVFVFYKRGLLPLFVTAEIWIVIYCCINIRPFSIKELLMCMFFAHKPEVHLWYVRLIILYYLMLPFLNQLRKKWKGGFVGLVCIIVAFTFLYNGWLIFHGSPCPTSSSRSYFCYIVYMAVAYALSKNNIAKMCTWIFVVLGILGGYVLYLSMMSNSYFLWYDNPLLAVVAICLFVLIRVGLEHVSKCGILGEVSRMSYGIYLSHFLLVYLAGMVLEGKTCGILVFYLVWGAILLFDAAVIFGMKRVSARIAKILFRY